jgi:hypothetical protein
LVIRTPKAGKRTGAGRRPLYGYIVAIKEPRGHHRYCLAAIRPDAGAPPTPTAHGEPAPDRADPQAPESEQRGVEQWVPVAQAESGIRREGEHRDDQGGDHGRFRPALQGMA